MLLVLPTLYAFIFVSLIYKMKFFEISSVSKTTLVVLFGLKLVAAAVVYYVYTSYYSGSDFFTYFSDSNVLIHNFFGQHQRYSPAWNGNFENVLFSSSRVMIVLNAALHIFSFGNFYVHAVFFCFFSFIGLVGLLKAFTTHFPDRKKRLIFALFFIPSILFWGSSALKESVIIGIVGLIVYVSDFGLRKKYTLPQLILLLILVVLLLFVKIYVLFALLPVVLVNTLVARTSNKFLFVKYAVGILFIALLAVLLTFVNADYNVLKLVSDKQAKAISEAKGGAFLVSDQHFIRVNYEQEHAVLIPQKDSTFRIKAGSSYSSWNLENMRDTTFVTNAADTSAYYLLYSIQPAHSVIPLKRLKPELADFITYSPIAFLNTLLHPTIFEVTSWLHLLIAVENLGIILLILLAIFFFDKTVLEKKEILFFCLFFAITLFVLIGMTTPATGAMVRYKTIALLFLVVGCLLMISEEKVTGILKKKNK